MQSEAVAAFPDGAVQVGLDGSITPVSVEAERVLGYRPGELVGRPAVVLVSDDAGLSRTVGVEVVCAAFQAEAGVRCRRKDGTRFMATAAISPLDTEYGGGIRMMIHPFVAHLDPGWVHQMLDALVDSADEAIAVADPGGTILLWNPAAERMLGHRASQVVGFDRSLAVTDLDPRLADDVFEQVMRGEHLTLDTHRWLARDGRVVISDVTNVGGHVAIYSEPGHGTTATAMLPAIKNDPEAAASAAPAAPGPAPGDPARHTLLVVDDEVAIRDIAARVLARASYTVLIAEGGPAALALATGHPGPIDLVPTDVVVPNMNGNKLVQQLQQQRPELAVVFMSGYPQPILTANGDLDTDAHVLQKPFTRAGLLTAVADNLTRTPGR